MYVGNALIEVHKCFKAPDLFKFKLPSLFNIEIHINHDGGWPKTNQDLYCWTVISENMLRVFHNSAHWLIIAIKPRV